MTTAFLNREKDMGWFKALWFSLIEGLVEWKMPLFRGALYAFIPAAISFNAGLQDYLSLNDLDSLNWLKITLAAVIAGGSAMAGFLDSSFTRTKDRIRVKTEMSEPSK